MTESLKSRMDCSIAIAPLLLVFAFSVTFLTRGIDSWFQAEVRQGLSDALGLSRSDLLTLARAWRPEMEALLLLIPRDRARGYAGPGDFALDATGRLARGTTFVYTGAQILRTEGLAEMSDPVFSLNRLWDRAAERGGLFGLSYDGDWCDVGRPENLLLAEEILLRAGT